MKKSTLNSLHSFKNLLHLFKNKRGGSALSRFWGSDSCSDSRSGLFSESGTPTILASLILLASGFAPAAQAQAQTICPSNMVETIFSAENSPSPAPDCTHLTPRAPWSAVAATFNPHRILGSASGPDKNSAIQAALANCQTQGGVRCELKTIHDARGCGCIDL